MHRLRPLKPYIPAYILRMYGCSPVQVVAPTSICRHTPSSGSRPTSDVFRHRFKKVEGRRRLRSCGRVLCASASTHKARSRPLSLLLRLASLAGSVGADDGVWRRMESPSDKSEGKRRTHPGKAEEDERLLSSYPYRNANSRRNDSQLSGGILLKLPLLCCRREGIGRVPCVPDAYRESTEEFRREGVSSYALRVCASGTSSRMVTFSTLPVFLSRSKTSLSRCS